jgi:hypothetical protein
VYLAGTQTRATLFSDSSETPLGNPAYADASAQVFLYTSAERVDIQITKGGYVAPLMRDILVVDVTETLAEMQDLAAGARASAEAAIFNSEAYASIAAGRAAVADGEHYLVVGSGVIAAYKYQRVDASTSTLITSYPSGALISSVQWSAQSVGGTANAIAVTTERASAVYFEKMRVWFEAASTSTGSVTLSVDGGTAGALTKSLGGTYGNGEIIAGRRYEAEWDLPGNVWRVVSDSSVSSRVATVEQAQSDTDDDITAVNAALTATDNKIKNAGSFFVSNIGGTADAITGDCAFLPTPVEGTRVVLFASATNTAPTTLAINGGAAIEIYKYFGASLDAGDLKANVAYELIYDTPGNKWRVCGYPQDHDRVAEIYSRASVSGGTANAIEVTTIDRSLYAHSGFLMLFEPAQENTGATTIATNSGSARNVVKGNNSPLAGGEMKVGYPVLLRYSGSPSNNWKIISSGVLLADSVAVVSGRVDALEAQAESRIEDFIPQLISNPWYSNISFSDGVRTITPHTVTVGGVGSSVGTGAGVISPDLPEDFAPSQLLINRMSAALAGHGYSFTHDNQSVGGTVISQFLSQYAAIGTTPNFVTITAGMNDFRVGGYNRGTGFGDTIGHVEAIIDAIVADGGIPLLFTTPHPHPDRYAIEMGTQSMIWPFLTFNVSTTFTVDASAQTIFHNTAFSFDPWGGNILKVGDTLLASGGSNDGTYTISTISVDRKTLTFSGGLTSSVTEDFRLRHNSVDPETILVPPASESWVDKDWTGNGIISTGDVRFMHGNNMLRRIAREKNIFLLDAEYYFFKNCVEGYAGGYDDAYTSPNFNHPNGQAYEDSFGAAIDDWMTKLNYLTFR